MKLAIVPIVIILLHIRPIDGVVKTTMGKLFLATYPGLPDDYSYSSQLPEVCFLMSTPSEKEIRVYMRTESTVGFAVARLDFNLTSKEVKEYLPPGDYLRKAATGKKMTFRFYSQFDFIVSMFTMVDVHTASIVQLTAVESWGNSYIVFTLSENPFISVINFESENRLTVLYRSESKEDFETPNEIMVPGNKYRILLQKYESYSLSDCREVPNVASWTGTSIKGNDQFGVISGNCLSHATAVQCDNSSIYYEKDNTRDAAAEMLMPTVLYGKEFIAPNQPERISPGYVVVVAAESETLVEHSVSNSRPKDVYMLRQEGDYVMLNETSHATLITSNKGIQVFYVQRSKCRKPGPYEHGDVSIVVVVPVQLYYHSYHIYISAYIYQSIDFLIIIVHHDFISHLLLDGKEMSERETWYPVVGKPPWQVTHVLLERGVHTLTTRVSFNYACYVYGHSKEVSYMTTVDYAVAGLNKVCTRNLKLMEPGDYEDNDCDGEVDEEMPDNIDNDLDSLIDEDLIDIKYYATTMGTYFVLAVPEVNVEHPEQTKFMLSLVTQVRGDALVDVSCQPLGTLNTTVRVTLEKSIFIPINLVAPSSSTGERKTVKASGNKMFGLMAMMQLDRYSIDIVTAIPVDGWGTRYLAVTVGLTPSIVIIANAPLQAIINFRSAANVRNFFSQSRRKIVVDGNRVTIDVNRLWAFEISNCKSTSHAKTLTGSEITGNVAFGVVSGSCREFEASDECHNQTEGDTKDYTAEMLVPEQLFGREFVVLSFGSQEHSSEVIVVASEPGTVFQIARGHLLDAAGYILDEVGDWTSIHVTSHAALLSSNKPILVMQIYRASCIPHNLYRVRQTGDPSLGLLVPTSLFYYKYTWNVFSVISETVHYATALFNRLQISEFRLNKFRLAIKATAPVLGLKDWVIGTFKIGASGLYMMDSKMFAPFGLYVYAQHNEVAYLSFVGFVLSTINRRCKPSITVDCDYIDNDCDGRIDEETADDKDDDYDKIRGEDICSDPTMRPRPWGQRSTTTTATSPATAGLETLKIDTPIPSPPFLPSTTIPPTITSLTPHTATGDKQISDKTEISQTKLYIDVTAAKHNERTDELTLKTTTDLELPFVPENDALGFAWWSEWKCSRKCWDAHEYRWRKCIKPVFDDTMQCYGPTVEKRISHCYVSVRCPADCPKFTWGPDCKRSCAHCQEDCDPFFGNCTDCKAGFRFPSTGCSESCGRFHYGFHCAEDCMAKCSSDCLERIEGTCPRKSYVYLYPLWLLLLVPISIILFISERKIVEIIEKRSTVVQPPESFTEGSSL